MHKKQNWLVYGILSVAVFFIAFPILFAFVKASQSSEQILSSKLLPGSYFWHNVQGVWNHYNFGRYLANSLIISFFIVLGKTALSFFAAFALVFLEFKWKKPIFVFILVTLMMPTEMLIVGLFDLISLQPAQSYGDFFAWLLNPQQFLLQPSRYGLGWSDSLSAIIVPFMASATAVFFFRQHFLNVPPSLVDAALIDGASPFRFIRSVLLPLSTNTIGALVVVQFVFAWNQYLWPRVIIRSDEYQVVQIALKNMMAASSEGADWGLIMAGTVLSLIPPLIVLFVFQKQLMKGIAFSEDK